jgi:flagellar protein FliS
VYPNNQYAYDTYKSTQVETAPKKKLLLMLYDGAIRFLKLGSIAIDNRNYQEANKKLIRTQDILMELMNTLNFDAGEIAYSLYQIYDFMYVRIIDANIHKDKELLVDVIRMLQELRDTWDQI